MNKTRLIVIATGLTLAAVGGGVWWFVAHRVPAPRYVTAAASQGDVSRQITASGSVNPVITVQVGAFPNEETARRAAQAAARRLDGEARIEPVISGGKKLWRAQVTGIKHADACAAEAKRGGACAVIKLASR